MNVFRVVFQNGVEMVDLSLAIRLSPIISPVYVSILNALSLQEVIQLID